MKLDKARKRDKKRNKRKHGMRVSGRSLEHIQNAIRNRAEKARAKKENQDD